MLSPTSDEAVVTSTSFRSGLNIVVGFAVSALVCLVVDYFEVLTSADSMGTPIPSFQRSQTLNRQNFNY